MKLVFLLAFGALMGAGNAEAAMRWRWTCAGPGFEAKGELTTGDQPDSNGFFAITGVTGMANGSAITALQPTKTSIPGNEGFPVDNLIRSKKPQLGEGGFGFSLRDGSSANPFFGEHLDPPGFYAVVSDPARHIWREQSVHFEAVPSGDP